MQVPRHGPNMCVCEPHIRPILRLRGVRLASRGESSAFKVGNGLDKDTYIP